MHVIDAVLDVSGVHIKRRRRSGACYIGSEQPACNQRPDDKW